MTNDQQKSWPTARSGFTLLEILIVGVLVSVLMLGVWSLFRSWGRLYERGERRVQTAQLVRSLCDQFTDDVRAVAYVAPPPRRGRRGPSGGSIGGGEGRTSSAGGNLALVGEANWLVLEVLQPPNPYFQPRSSDQTVAGEEEGTSLAAPELQRVMYTFEPPAAETLDSLSPAVAAAARRDDTELVAGEEEPVEPFSGLLRLAVATEQFDALATGNLAAGNMADEPTARSLGLRDAIWQLRELIVGPAGSDGLTASTRDVTTRGELREDAPTGASGIIEQDVVPEAVRLEFRYFDGSAWLSNWNSQSQGRLPVAIEMRFELKKPEPLETSTTSDEETDLANGGDSLTGADEPFLSADAGIMAPSDATADAVDSDYEATPYHRCVVYLEPAPEQPPTETTEEATSPAPGSQ